MTIFETLAPPFNYFLEPQQRTYWYYLFIAAVVGSLLYVFDKGGSRRKSLADLFAFLVPRSIYLHRSAVNDYFYFFANAFLKAIFILPFFSVLAVNVATSVEHNLNRLLPSYQDTFQSNGTALAIFFTVTLGCLLDFAIFFIHYLQHRVPWLWEFHKVHHSAQVLTPITVYRMHPIDDILTFCFSGLLVGTLTGVLQYCFKSEIAVINVSGTNLLFILFYMCLYNFRHSHIWIGYGPVFSCIFISPAQHQIHHSSDVRHRDKNMGFIFAFWDRLFGTLYVPYKKEKLSFGINPKEDLDFLNLWSLYLMPFINLARNFQPLKVLDRNNIGSLFLVCIIVGSAIYYSKTDAYAQSQSKSKSIFLEDMTWPEVKEAIVNGNTTVLVPTGGTEQNGPHLVLGKHNFIIRFTCGQIAQELRNALVAPVISYVPEGNIDPPDGHMLFPGTLSVSNRVFADLLESTARSLKAHGFEVIAFVGDSGGNISAQEEVADRLNRAWSDEGVRVINVSDYYHDNGQTRYLLNAGYTTEQIGSHAGIRDTSELMAAYPQGVRTTLLANYTTNKSESSGANGDPRRANPRMGNALLNLKIQSGIEQIRKALM